MKRILIILLTLNSTLLTLNSYSQWVQQSVPVTSGIFNDMKFVNANTGFIAHYSYPVGTFLKTTNAGYNWTVNLNAHIHNISVVDSLNIYCTVNRGLYDKLFKTTNCGISWDSSLTTPLYLGYLYFFNKDTGMISIGDGSNNYIARITDGGQSYQIIATYGGASAGTFFFLKEKINGEYYGWMYYQGSFIFRSTTNSGLSWVQLPYFAYDIRSMFFVNKDTGWVTASSESNFVYMTTNSGLNWVGKNLNYPTVYLDICFANSQKGWASGWSNKICVTTNGGNNWGYQNVPGGYSEKLFFLDSVTGWVTTSINTISHTTNGGGTITSIISGSTETQKDYKLYQNYPNPFNSTSNLKFEIVNLGRVKIIVYDVMGREVQTLVNETLQPGTYEATFDGSRLGGSSTSATGIYFYQLTVDNKIVQTRKMILLK